jgi:hypothetical protein
VAVITVTFMKPKIYPILEECIESGILFGFRRAFKHTDDPSEEQVVEHMLREIMNDLILNTNGYDVRVLCKPSEDVTVNNAGKILELTTRLIDELWAYDVVNISIKTDGGQEDSTQSTVTVTEPMGDLFKVHEDNMMRVYNEQRTTS